MALRKLAEPQNEAITLAEAKLHLRVTESFDDAMITAQISAAREQAETLCRRSIMPTQWLLTLDEFPSSIRLPMPRVLSSPFPVVQFIDPAGALQTLSPSAYRLDNAGDLENWLYPAPGYAWPETQYAPNSVMVTYTAGYENAAAVPRTLVAWMKLAIGDMYANREATITGTIQARLEFAARLLDGYIVPLG